VSKPALLALPQMTPMSAAFTGDEVFEKL